MKSVSTIQTRKRGNISSPLPLPADTRELLRALGTVALKLADNQPVGRNWLIEQFTSERRVKTTTDADKRVGNSLLTLTEACAHLRISKWSVYKLIHNKEIITVKVGSRRFVPAREVERYLAALIAAGGML